MSVFRVAAGDPGGPLSDQALISAHVFSPLLLNSLKAKGLTAPGTSTSPTPILVSVVSCRDHVTHGATEHTAPVPWGTVGVPRSSPTFWTLLWS